MYYIISLTILKSDSLYTFILYVRQQLISSLYKGEISRTKIVILDQSKPISIILKIEKSKTQKFKICKLQIYYS